MLRAAVGLGARHLTKLAAVGTRCVSTAVLEPISIAAPATRVLRMNRPPVNSLSLELLEDMATTIAEAEADPECRALVLASAQPTVFSAGLDITEMHAPDASRLRRFWSAFQEVWLRLSSSKLATVAAVEGHSPAGGCILAICCDYRVMATGDPVGGKAFRIGLNETKLGIVAPPWVAETFQSIVGLRQADFMLQRGSLITAEDAVAVGLVDEAVAQDEVMARAAVAVEELLAVPDMARHQSKMFVRQPMIDRLVAQRDADTESFATFVLSSKVQQSLTSYLGALKKRSAKAS